MKSLLTVIIFCILLSYCPVYPFTELSGEIDRDTTVTDTVYVTSNLTIKKGVRLTLKPGVRMIAPKKVRIIVNGSISAMGTADAPIVFNGYNDEKWAGISIINTIDTSEFYSCTITNCQTDTSIGAFYIYKSPNVKIRDCTISHNSGKSDGGGLHIVASAIQVNNTLIENNTANAGAGIFVTNGNPVFKGCTIRNNESTQIGGGIVLSGSDAYIDSCFIEKNSSRAAKILYGGGIFISKGNPQIVNSRITANFIYVSQSGYDGYGGGVFLDGCKPVFTATEFKDNYCGSYVTGNAWGGAIYSKNSTLTLKSCLLTGNRLEKGYNSSGGGICISGGVLKLFSTTINFSKASSGGGIGSKIENTQQRMTVEIDSCRIEQNLSYLKGGGMWLTKSDISARNSSFSGNTTTHTELDNAVAESHGAGISLEECTAGFENCAINGNLLNSYAAEAKPNSSGGGIYTSQSTVSFISCSLNSNRSVSQGKLESNKPRSLAGYSYGGGGIFIGSHITLTHCTLDSNHVESNSTSQKSGCGLYISQSDCLIMNCGLKGNYSESVRKFEPVYGGGIYLTRSQVTCIGSVFQNNKADSAKMICSADSFSTLTMINGTLYDNDTLVNDNQLFLNGTITIKNSIIYNTKCDTGIIYLGRSCSPLIENSLIKGGMEGFRGPGAGSAYYVFNYKNNIQSEPLFSNPENGDLTLGAGSECINKGLTDTSGLMLPEHDITGKVRIIDGRVDIGAYESGVSKIKFSLKKYNFPDPYNIIYVNDLLTIECRQQVMITICDLKGSLVYRGKSAKTYSSQIMLDFLPSNVYILQIRSIENNRILFSRKYIKNR